MNSFANLDLQFIFDRELRSKFLKEALLLFLFLLLAWKHEQKFYKKNKNVRK